MRAPNGSGSIFWDKSTGRFVGLLSVGRGPDNRRIRPKVTGHSVDQVQAKLDALREDFDRGIDLGNDYTVADACEDFLAHGMHHLAEGTADELRRIVGKWILPHLGHAKLKELKADEVDAWLDVMARELSTGSVKKRLSTLRRIIRFAEAHNHASRNVAALVDAPRGQLGRPSKALTLEQTMALLDTSRHRPIRGYIALSVFTGIRTEEARPLEWRHLHLNPTRGQICSCGQEHLQTVAPHVEIWRSVRAGGDTKTAKSRRTIGLPALAVEILTEHQEQQQKWRAEHGWKSEGIVYVFGTRTDTVQVAESVHDQVQKVATKAGLPGSWTPRELRHTFTSLLSEAGAPVELIADLLGHKDLATTWKVYRHQLRPVITAGAELLDKATGQHATDHKGESRSQLGSQNGSQLASAKGKSSL
ncbi:site-specific integrase [Glycomyces luteolus]|jgi:integrase|uniref:Site-specific integrase n=2 Tax=Glycomyces TaxID=58113 RepID=A0A9X3PBS4_9ACTN|nr:MULTISPECIES: site-specific integrase [Glycomyces]MDA1362493.1 site-specific integrase [Glycomyces luteolus]MDN3239170.1 site-specific integrase [Glycomyces tritici]